MERWVGKVALVTGASAGIGAAIAVALANSGLKVVGIARRAEKVEALKKSVTGSGELHAFKADVSNEDDIEATFKFIKDKFGAIHVLVNNAGIFRPGKIYDQDPKFIREVLNVNVVGLSISTQKAIKLMQEAGVDDGHIIHINSVAGHGVPNFPEPTGSAYAASKHAVTALTETLRQELRFLKSKIRITSISPGHVTTEIFEAAAKGVGVSSLGDVMNTRLSNMPALESEDIADAVVYVISTPPRVQVHELIIKPSVSPGFVATEIFEAAAKGVGVARVGHDLSTTPSLQPQDIADGIVYVLSTPPRVQVHELTIKPVGELV